MRGGRCPKKNRENIEQSNLMKVRFATLKARFVTLKVRFVS